MPASKQAPDAQPAMVHHLHALLHTMRVIQQQEDEFCTVAHAVERAGTLRTRERRELERLLTQVPAESLLHDLDSIRAVLLQQPSTGEPLQETASPAHVD